MFILLVYDYENTSSQTYLLKYQFQALENVTRGMSGPVVACGGTDGGIQLGRQWRGLAVSVPPSPGRHGVAVVSRVSRGARVTSNCSAVNPGGDIGAFVA